MNQPMTMGHPGMQMMGGMDYNGFGDPMMFGMGPGAMGMMAMHPAMMAGFGGPMAAMGSPPGMGPGGGNAGFSPAMMHGGVGLNHAQRALLAQEQLFHANRIDAIIHASHQKNGSNPPAGGGMAGNGDESAANMMQAGAGMMNRFVQGPTGSFGGGQPNMSPLDHDRMMYRETTAPNHRSFLASGAGGLAGMGVPPTSK